MVVADRDGSLMAGVFPRFAITTTMATTAAATAMATHRRQRVGRVSFSGGGVDGGSGWPSEDSDAGITSAGDAFIGILPP